VIQRRCLFTWSFSSCALSAPAFQSQRMFPLAFLTWKCHQHCCPHKVFPGWGNVNILLIILRLMTMRYVITFVKRFTLTRRLHHKGNAPRFRSSHKNVLRHKNSGSTAVTKTLPARSCKSIPSAMPKSVMRSAAKNGKDSMEKKRKILAVLTETPQLKRFFSEKLLRSKVKTVALTGASENVGENHDKILKHLSHSDWLVILACNFSGVLFVISGFCLLFAWMLFLA